MNQTGRIGVPEISYENKDIKVITRPKYINESYNGGNIVQSDSMSKLIEKKIYWLCSNNGHNEDR